MAAVNLISSIIVMASSLWIIFLSLKMPRPGGWPTAPGLVPLMISIAIFLMGGSLLISSIKNKGGSQLITKLRNFSLSQSISHTKTKRLLFIIFLTGAYFFILLNILPFEISSFIYLSGALHFFWRKGGWLKILAISIVVPFAFSVSFVLIFKVFIPGGTVLNWLFF